MRRSALVIALALGACGSPPRTESDWEKRTLQGQPVEEPVAPPAYPQPAQLVQVRLPDADGFRFYIDRSTLAVGKDGVVRYVLVARSPEGAQNVTFEGLRCDSAENRVLAVGQPDRTWAVAHSGWRPISAPRHLALYRDFFCPQGETVRSSADAVRVLERGGR